MTYTYDDGDLTTDTMRQNLSPPSTNRQQHGLPYRTDLSRPIALGDIGWDAEPGDALRTRRPRDAARRLTYSGSTVTDSGSTIADPRRRIYTCTAAAPRSAPTSRPLSGSMQLPGDASPAVQVTPGPAAQPTSSSR